MATLARTGQKIPRVVLSIAGLLLVIGLMAVGLTVWSRITALPSTVLTSPVCPAPCWYGLRPGVTTASEVMILLSEQPGVNGGSIREWSPKGQITQLAWLFQRPAGDTAGYAYFDSERCTALTIITQGSLTLSQALEKFGQPQLLFTQTGQAGARAWVEVDLVYPSAGYVVEADLDPPAKTDPAQVVIGKQTPIMRVTYFAPDRFEAMLGAGTLTNSPAGLNQTGLRPWPGLGRIDYARP